MDDSRRQRIRRRRRWVSDPSASPELLGSYCRDVNVEVREAVAENPRCSPGTLAVLLRDWRPAVRARAFENPSTSLDLVLDLPLSMVPARFLARHLQGDPRWEVVVSLGVNWEGTVGELLQAADRLGPDCPPPGPSSPAWELAS